MKNEREQLGNSYTLTKNKLKRLMEKNYKVVMKTLRGLSNTNLLQHSVFSSWMYNDTLLDLESVFLLKTQVNEVVKERGVRPLWCEEPLKEFDKTLKFKN